jgi:hypothetical protein
MSESVEKCARCGLPLIGPVFQVHVECAELAPKRPELQLCQPCMESLNRWLLHRQTVVRATAETRPAAAHDTPAEHSRRRFTERLERSEANVNRQERARMWKTMVIIGITVLATILFTVYFVISTSGSARAPGLH